jgi:protein-tyrosine phosphatase
MQRVLFVCLGNICRSPTAEGVLRAQLVATGAQARIAVDSAGTGDWHVGSPPDARAIAAAARRGYDLSVLRARQVDSTDFHHHDHIVAMDRRNLAGLQALAPPAARARLSLLSSWIADGRFPDEVPDPYYGGEDGFEFVLDMLEAGCAGLLAHLQEQAR